MHLSKQEVIKKCEEAVNWNLLSGNNYTLCVDGTSCTKKSSILNATGRLCTKISKMNNFQNTDTYFPSMIGYICRGMLSLREGGPHFNDRSPLNVLDWAFLWRLLNDFLVSFGNVRPSFDDEAHRPFLENAVSMIQNFRDSYYRKMFSRQINCVVIIDSDVDRCDQLRMQRSESSDYERSQWKFYTFFQNLMYKELYSGLCIDLTMFKETETDVVVEGIADFCNMTLNNLIETRVRPSPRPLPVGKLPTIACDYNLSNMETHIYRSVGRRACKAAVGINEEMHKYVPAYCNVSNIKNLDGTRHPDIVAKRVDHLFNIDQNVLIDGNYYQDDELISEDLMMDDSGIF